MVVVRRPQSGGAGACLKASCDMICGCSIFEHRVEDAAGHSPGGGLDDSDWGGGCGEKRGDGAADVKLHCDWLMRFWKFSDVRFEVALRSWLLVGGAQAFIGSGPTRTAGLVLEFEHTPVPLFANRIDLIRLCLVTGLSFGDL